MGKFDFLIGYITEVSNASTLKHRLFKVDKNYINEVNSIINIPYELLYFYENIGCGFFHKQSKNFALMSPETFKQINLKQDFYEFDPQLEVYDFLYQGEKLLFFEVIEGNYLAIDRKDISGRNPIYHFEKKIYESLEDFLIALDNDAELLNDSP